MTDEQPIEVELDDGVRVSWDAEKLGDLASPAPNQLPARPWKLSASVDWKRWDSMRVISAAFGDGALVAFASLRPKKAKGHDCDRSGSLLVRDGTPHGFEEFLMSMQHDGAGELRRVNVEAYLDTDGVPLRLSGDVTSQTRTELNGDLLEVNVLQAHLSGREGLATVDVLRPA